MTRAERIRKMTDEELKTFLCDTVTEECIHCLVNDICKPNSNGYEKWLSEEIVGDEFE